MKVNRTDTVVTSRIRLARNFDGYNFSPLIVGTDVERCITGFVAKLFRQLGGYEIFHMSKIADEIKQSFVERYLISKGLAKSKLGAVAISEDKCISVMINEEDHIRVQCIQSGLDLVGALQRIRPVDSLLMRNFRFAKDGVNYLTACPSNFGTGMRASIMMFLPSLCYTNSIEKVFSSAKSLAITARGAFGEGSEAEGFWFQISNSRTIGTVDQIIENVERFVKFVSDAETEERIKLYNKDKDDFEDNCFRAWGVLKNCRLLPYDEFLHLISQVKLGESLGLIPLKNPQALDDLVVTVRPSTLKLLLKSEENELKLRAAYVSKALNIIQND